MRNGRDVTDYFLFYATSNLLGLKKMKEAMWKIDEAGEFLFSDATNADQFTLFEKSPNAALLRKLVLDRFSGRRPTVGDIEEHILVDTAFRETHYKRQVLGALEEEGLLEVLNPHANRRKGTFSDPAMIVSFKER